MPRVAVDAPFADETEARLYRELRGRRDLWQSGSLEAISRMYRAQTSLCEQVTRPLPSVDAYDAAVRQHVQSFDQAAAGLDMEYRPAAGERVALNGLGSSRKTPRPSWLTAEVLP